VWLPPINSSLLAYSPTRHPSLALTSARCAGSTSASGQTECVCGLNEVFVTDACVSADDLSTTIDRAADATGADVTQSSTSVIDGTYSAVLAVGVAVVHKSGNSGPIQRKVDNIDPSTAQCAVTTGVECGDSTLNGPCVDTHPWWR
jgi:hypothetical protein